MSVKLILLFSLSFQTVVWCGVLRSKKCTEGSEREHTTRDPVAQCSREWEKKVCCFDTVDVSERPERAQPWGGRRYRSPGLWMRGTGR